MRERKLGVKERKSEWVEREGKRERSRGESEEENIEGEGEWQRETGECGLIIWNESLAEPGQWHLLELRVNAEINNQL